MYRYGGSRSLLRAHANLTVVVGHDAMDDCEAEAAALGKAAVKWLKQVVQLLRGYSDALVAHGQQDAARRLGGGAEQQASACWHRAQAVGGQVPDDLLDLALVG